jgi:hypothetical protein
MALTQRIKEQHRCSSFSTIVLGSSLACKKRTADAIRADISFPHVTNQQPSWAGATHSKRCNPVQLARPLKKRTLWLPKNLSDANAERNRTVKDPFIVPGQRR